MKKKLLLGAGVLVVGLLAFFGRDLIGLYRLLAHIEATTEAYEAVGPWPQLADACFGCHGDKGSSQHQRYPSLAAQPAAYLSTQLERFAQGQRSYPNMGPLAMTLSAQEIDWLASYYASQPAQANQAFEPDPALRERGAALAASGACAACHGQALMGQAHFPRLAGQGADYLLAQLDAFAQGRRIDPSGSMQAVTATLSPADRKALSHYLAALAPTAK
ncbi:c-type cytochrome [Pseudomonas sp. TUM22785]|uniref:c-type cytochrome n=1 Tax=Pseudomonas sp. TUM22785 TaxID=3019098 RepID=UPI002305460D|nr:c-type cytochrome [Pseudomonas sp. TUM22785]WCD77898.1 c-type cytochrome [Pseudomonas sp. TUM22785]